MLAPVFAAFMLVSMASHASATDLYKPQGFSALASDQTADSVGDLITILVYENASASNAASSSSRKSMKIDGSIGTTLGLEESGNLGTSGGSESTGSMGRSGKMVAQFSAIVEQVLPNGDLQIRGEQHLDIAGERTLLRIKGRIRKADILPSNVVLSSRIGDAYIEYNGKGFVSRSGKPGIVAKIFSWLGLA